MKIEEIKIFCNSEERKENDGDHNGYYDFEALSDYDIELLEPLGSYVLSYYYATAPYEGYGAGIIIYKDGYNTVGLGHCSCYGPTEDIIRNLVTPWASLKELWEGLSYEAQAEQKENYDRLIKEGYK